MMLKSSFNVYLALSLLCGCTLCLEWIPVAKQPWSAANVRLHKLAMLRGKLDAMDLSRSNFNRDLPASEAYRSAFRPDWSAMQPQLVLLALVIEAAIAQLICNGLNGGGCLPLCGQGIVLPNVALNTRVAAALSEYACYPGVPYWMGGAAVNYNVPIVGTSPSNIVCQAMPYSTVCSG
ncbi:unnamed protein product [Toxocara canis]|uniref:Uncharacterized protein n=1 Tax=Toxocara canis TaxID=6265 RepID=A0A183UG56_TOXCA|nr:unnamed protein product [Toxocara canis]